ncbi:MAG: ribonuclease HI family protein [bacterium]
MADYRIHIDGSSRRNPGPAGIGVEIADSAGRVVKEISHSIGIRTNNQAEYEALLCALRECAALRGTVVIRTDSELLYYQMKGKYRVRDAGLKPLNAEATRLAARLPDVRLELVRREHNKAADKLAQAASERAAQAHGAG